MHSVWWVSLVTKAHPGEQGETFLHVLANKGKHSYRPGVSKIKTENQILQYLIYFDISDLINIFASVRYSIC